MLCKLVAMLLAIMTLFMQFAMAEEERECACCGCAILQAKHNSVELVDPIELTVEEAYKEWFLVAYPLLYACYANSMQVDDISGWKNGSLKSLDVTFLLREDILSITEAELEEYKLVNDAVKLNYLDSIVPMYHFLHETTDCINIVMEAKKNMVREVPEKYKYIDDQLSSAMTMLIKMRSELRMHIVSNRSMEGYSSTVESKLISCMRGLTRVYELLE